MRTSVMRAFVVAELLTIGLMVTSGSAATREQVEADWQRQDQALLERIRRAGIARFAEVQLQWPGLEASQQAGLAVPLLSAPALDGRLDDACWTRATTAPPGPPDQPVRPVLRLARDAKHLYIGATFPAAAEPCFYPATTAADASGAVDGIKNGRYAFHTGQEPNPWWQVDLQELRAIGRVVIYNRLDYPPGLTNAYKLVVLTSDDGKTWTQRYDNARKPFGGATSGKPLSVDLSAAGKDGGPLQARFVRLQLPSERPIFLHLDEVEIYAPDKPDENIALGRPADQSSRSPWSRGGRLFSIDGIGVGLLDDGKTLRVTANGAALPDTQARLARHGGQTNVEVALPLARMPRGFPAKFTPFHSPPIRLAGGPAGKWRIAWPEKPTLGFGRNRIALELHADEALTAPIELTVEAVVFTRMRPETRPIARQTMTAAGTFPVEFTIDLEGAAAVIVTARQDGMSVRDGRSFLVAPLQQTLRRAGRLASEFDVALPKGFDDLCRRAEALDQSEKTVGPDPATRAALCREARWTAREIAFANPLIDFDKLLLVKRFTQETYPDICLNHMPWVSRPGGDICVVTLTGHDRPAEVRTLLDGRLGPGHVHGADLWWDPDRVVFGYAKAKSDQPPAGWLVRGTNFDLRRNEEPTHLFEVGIDGSGLRQLTSGEWSDLDPTYLANGDVAFVSERCACSLQCNELDKDETSCNLYVMRGDGSHIRQMSVSKDGDYLPHALADGSIAYTRWEYQERSWAHIQSVWVIRPDGTGADALYKQHMNNPWALEDMRSIPQNGKLSAIATGHHTLAAGPVVVVDPDPGLNDPAGIRIVTPGVYPPEGGMTGTAVDEGGVVDNGGFYMTPWPLSERTFLVSYTYGPQTDAAGYAIYLIDVHGTKELVYRDPDISCSVPIPLAPRRKPLIVADVTDRSKDYAVCTLANVAYGVEGIDPKRIHYLRIASRDQWPYDNTHGGQRYEPDVKGVMVNWTPARVIGTVPVEADGSASFRVPADVPVYFQLLDENQMELRRMRSFISFQPGEIRGCAGCHETRAVAPPMTHGPFPLAMMREPRIPTPSPWGDRAISFLRDVQPVFDRHCTGCHAGAEPAGGLDFSGGLTARYNRAYDTIQAHGLISRSNVGDDAKVTPPLAFGSHKSKLVEVLRDGACSKRAKLSSADWLRLVTWIDLNGPYHDGFINKRPAVAPYDLPADAELVRQIAAIHAKRCASCHQPNDVTRADWIDLRRPEQSRFLTAPLSTDADGTGLCQPHVYRDCNDPDYQAVLKLVETAVTKAWQRPRRDVKGLVQR